MPEAMPTRMSVLEAHEALDEVRAKSVRCSPGPGTGERNPTFQARAGDAGLAAGNRQRDAELQAAQAMPEICKMYRVPPRIYNGY